MKALRALCILSVLLVGTTCLARSDYDSADITSKSDDGAVIRTDDGNTWIINSTDRTTSSLWLVTETVIEIDDSNSCTKWELLNKDDNNSSVCAEKH